MFLLAADRRNASYCWSSQYERAARPSETATMSLFGVPVLVILLFLSLGLL